MVQGSCRLPCFAALQGGVKSPVRTAWGGRHQGVRAIDDLHHRVAFVTAIPQSVHRGSGCYVGIQTLATGVRALGVHVEMITPMIPMGRYLFNQALRWRREWNYDAVIGFDLDGFALPRRGVPPHIANIKGVLADAVPFERGLTRANMALQSRWEAEHARRADLVITISQYCKDRLRKLYGVRSPIAVVPELIDLDAWRRRFLSCPAAPDPRKFTVLSVCRFYPRKRLDVLLRAAALLKDRIPGFQIRIVGNGPERRPNCLRGGLQRVFAARLCLLTSLLPCRHP